MNAYVSFMNTIAANKELKHSTQACNSPTKTNTKTEQQYMVSGVGYLIFTGQVCSWFSLNGRRNRSRTGVTIAYCTKFWPSYCKSSGVRITLPKLNPTNPCIPHTQ